MATPLNDYLEAYGVSKEEFAKKSATPLNTVKVLASAYMPCSLTAAVRIAKASDWAVPIESLLSRKNFDAVKEIDDRPETVPAPPSLAEILRRRADALEDGERSLHDAQPQ